MKFSYVEFHENTKDGYNQSSVAGRQTVTQTDRRECGRGLHLKRSLLPHKERLVTNTSDGKPCVTELVQSPVFLCPAYVYASLIGLRYCATQRLSLGLMS